MQYLAFQNFLTVSVLNYAIFSLFFAIYLLILPERTAATRDLIFLFLIGGIIAIAYFLTYLVPLPIMAYHRWITLAGSLFATSHITVFFLNFPEPVRPGLRRLYMIATNTVSVVFILVFMVESSGARKIYQFDGHFYDLDLPLLGRLAGLLILLYVVFFLIAGIDCARRSLKPAVGLTLLLAFCLIVLLPGIANIFHRYHIVTRNVFQTVWNVFGVLGTFILLITYVGVMRERTTLLMKVFAMILMTVLLILQIVDFSVLRDRESLFDELSIQQAGNMIRDRNLRPGDLACIRKFEEGGGATSIYAAPDLAVACQVPVSMEPVVSGERGYRMEREGSERKYVTYTVQIDGHLYQVDFRYESYRVFLSQIASKMNLLQIGIIILIASGYPFFFLRILLLPLHGLRSGVEKVNRGDLDVHVPVKSADELGFLTLTFNSMVDSIRTARSELKNHADQLELRVKVRTEELQKSFAEVQSLKELQDGDYFLTARLIRPLSSNTVPEDGPCRVRFALRQKKRFHFRHWTEEIGGDFCTAHRVYLKGRPFTFCVNADAMGKSIQGAGGALVLGAVVKSLVERSVHSPADREVLPEIWLKRAFVELHRVFESFDGSMLVSAIMALLDGETGFLYYINAEHPRPILYRDGKAWLFGEDQHLRKLGTTGMEGFISIRTMALRPGDTVILASDGRDDVILDQSHPGGPLNNDETRFLQFVEEGDGDPERILDLFAKSCEPVDDVSALALMYRPQPADSLRRYIISARWRDALVPLHRNNFEVREAINMLNHALQEYPGNVYLHRLISRYYMRAQQHGRAIIHMEKYIRLQPEDEYILFRLFLLLMKRGFYARAAEYGEVYHLRHPEDPRVMGLLADLSGKLNNHAREEKFRRMLRNAEGAESASGLVIPREPEETL